jgi:hypothetical protein
LTKPVRLELIDIIQRSWVRIPVLQQLVEKKLINAFTKIGKTDFIATHGKFEAFLKNNIGTLFGAPTPINLGHTSLLTSDTPIRINMAIDQGDGRIPDTLLASKYAKIPDNKLTINTTLTIAGLVDPGRFFLIQRMGYTSLLSGLFNIDNPFINGKIVMDDVKFSFYYKPNKNNTNNRRQHLFTANYNVQPRTTGGSTIDIMTLNLSNKNGAVQLRPGSTAKEGDITKFFGDFYQVLINNAYNKDRKGGSYYTLGSGDGVMIAMNTFITGVMGNPIAMIVDSGKLTESRSSQTQPVKVYFPPEVSKHLQVISDVNSPSFTGRTNKNNNNMNNAITSNVRANKKPPTPKVIIPRSPIFNKTMVNSKTPTAVKGKPATARGRPATARGRPATARGRPATARGRPATARGKPATARGTPVSASKTPRSARGRLARRMNENIIPEEVVENSNMSNRVQTASRKRKLNTAPTPRTTRARTARS